MNFFRNTPLRNLRPTFALKTGAFIEFSLLAIGAALYSITNDPLCFIPLAGSTIANFNILLNDRKVFISGDLVSPYDDEEDDYYDDEEEDYYDDEEDDYDDEEDDYDDEEEEDDHEIRL